MVEFTLKHHKHPGHTSTVATGVSIAGPSSDGFVHVTFYRDMLTLVEEYFDAEEREIPGGKEMKLRAKKTGDRNKTDMGREDVATVLLPAASFAAFAKAFKTMEESLPERLQQAKPES